MKDFYNPPSADPDLAKRVRIDEICDRFECLWKAERTPPDLATFLQTDEIANAFTEREDLLIELIAIDRPYRESTELATDVDYYCQRFPQSRELIDQIFSGEAQTIRTLVDDATIDSVFTGEQPIQVNGNRIRYFGDYELINEIACGGMGVVYRARQISLNREIALKMILAGQIADTDQIRRFQIEAEAPANLYHIGIVPIYEIGEFQGQHYFSMKLIEGETLSEYANKLRGDHDQIIEKIIAIAIADSVHHAHQRGILHRDLKR